MEKYGLTDASNSGNGRSKRFFGCYPYPISIVELHLSRGNQFLKTPPSAKPTATTEFRLSGTRVYPCSGGIYQVYVAHISLFIPSKHRVNGFGEFGRVLLIDTARIDPGVFVAVSSGLVTHRFDFAVPRSLPRRVVPIVYEFLHFLKVHFFVPKPRMA